MGETVRKILNAVIPEAEPSYTIAQIVELYGFHNPETPRIRLKRAGLRPWYGLTLARGQRAVAKRPVAMYDQREVHEVLGTPPGYEEDEAPRQEPCVRLELTRSELAALIHRLVPADTWMGERSSQVISRTFNGDAEEARRVADRVTAELIQIHDDIPE